MTRLTLLGDIDLRNPQGHRVGSVLSQPKRLALLSILAVAGRPVQRDELIGLLWPDMDQADARNALRQGIHYLRRSLGSEAITGVDAVEIGAGRISCDAADLLAALEEERLAEAVDLYHGDLLPGFYLDGGTAEFEHWLEEQRSRIRRAVADAAWKIADAERLSGNRAGAGAAARRAYELSGWDEAALQRLLRLLADIGDRAGALSLYEQYVDRVRSEFGLEPSAAVQELVNDIRTPDEGERAAQEPGGVAARLPMARVEIESTGAPASGPRRLSAAVRSLGSALAAAGIAIVFFSLWGIGGGDARQPDFGLHTIYLEPLRDLGFPDPAPGLAAALNAELTSQLMEAPGLTVVLTNEAPARPGPGALKVSSRLLRHADRVRLSALLLDPVSGAVLDELRVDGEAGETLGSPAVLAGRLATKIRQSVGGMASIRELERTGGRAAAIAEIRQAAVDLATADSLSIAGASTPAELYYRSADSLLARVQRSEPQWTEPLLRRAEVALHEIRHHVYRPGKDADAVQQRFSEAWKVLAAALKLDANNARAIELQGLITYWAAAAAPSARRDSMWAASELYLQAAVERDPGRAAAWNVLSALQERRGEFARAYQSARRAYAADRQLADSRDVLVRLFTTALEVGDLDGASAWCDEIVHHRGEHWLGSYCDLSVLAWAPDPEMPAAEEAFRSALRLLADTPHRAAFEARVRLLYAVALARAGQPPAAGLLEGPDPHASGDPELVALRAWWLKETGRDSAAVATLQELTRSGGASSERVAKSRRFASLALN